jgi:hypothetical protein
MHRHNRKLKATRQNTQKSSPFFYRAAADTASVLGCCTFLFSGLGDPEPSAITVDSAATAAVALDWPLPWFAHTALQRFHHTLSISSVSPICGLVICHWELPTSVDEKMCLASFQPT